MNTSPTPAPHPSVEALRELLEKATPGPYEADVDDFGDSDGIEAVVSDKLVKCLWRTATGEEPGMEEAWQLARKSSGYANAEYVAALLNAAPALLSRLDVLRAENEALRETLKAAKAHIEQLCDDECPAVELDVDYDHCPVLCLIDEALTAAPRAQEPSDAE